MTFPDPPDRENSRLFLKIFDEVFPYQDSQEVTLQDVQQKAPEDTPYQEHHVRRKPKRKILSFCFDQQWNPCN